MTEQFKKMNLENYRISAVTPSDFDQQLEQKRPLTCGYPGCNTCEYEYACLCSHIKAMQEGLNSGDEYFIIMEDDILMPFEIDYDSMIKDLPKDLEILQMLILYGQSVHRLYQYWHATAIRYFPWQYLLPSTGMYLISREGAQKLVDMFYNNETQKYDFGSSKFQVVADVLLYSTVKTYASTVPYAVPKIEMGSEIHPGHLDAHEKAINDIQKVMMQHEHFPFPFVTGKNSIDTK